MDSIGNLLAHAADLHPDRTALLTAGGPLSYSALDQAVTRLSRRLLAAGARPGDRVAYLDENSHRAVVALFGTVRAGLIFVPVHPQLQPGEIATVFADAEPAFLLVGPGRESLVAALPPAVVPPVALTLQDADLAPAPAGSGAALPGVGPDDVAMLLYTSGTTGRPKGVMLTHRNCLSNADLQVGGYEMDAHTIAAVVVPHSVTGAINCMVIPTVQVGGALVYLPMGFRPEEFLRAVAHYRITHVQVVPTMVVRLLDYPGIREFDCSSLKAINYGSAPMPVSRLRDGVAKLGRVFCQVYGQTECTAMATCLPRVEHRLDAGERVLARLASCGRPQPGMRVRIVDAEGQEVPTGTVGEVTISGPNVMAGYWRRPEATAEALRDGWLSTGDLGRADADGYIYIVDRKKDIIKSGGMAVSPSEVEGVLYTHPAVLEAAVIGVPDPEWGEAVTAVVVLRPRAAATAAELIDYCRSRLAPYKKPKSVDFVPGLPKSPNGKILRRELRDAYRQAGADA